MRWVKFSRARDVLLLAGGLAVVTHETLWAVEPRWLLVTLAAGMMGLPGMWVADRKLGIGGTPPEPPSPPTLGLARGNSDSWPPVPSR